MPTPDASLSGTFSIGGDMPVHRLGFGAMRVTGSGIWGPPADPAEARRTLRRIPELGIDFIDTAEAYGPYISEELIAETLAPYAKAHVATKGGNSRQGPNLWGPLGRPEFLMQGVKTSLMRLKVERIDLWQLHRIDPRVPRDEQFAAIKTLLDDGVIRHAGLSEVSVEQIEAARKVFPVATVQNQYNLAQRQSEAVLDYCTANSIGFIPWYPLAAGDLARPGSKLAQVAARHGVTPGQIALAWVLKRSPVMLPIPGTSQVKHLEENVAAADIVLSDEEFAELSRLK